MNITVHRGTQQIGGSIIEVRTENTRVILDAGTELPPLDGSEKTDDIEVKGLTAGEPAFDAVFISHHHGDHCGLTDRLLSDIPVYAGKETSRILDVIADFTDGKSGRVTRFFENGKPCAINDMLITPLSVEHSAADAYMLLIQADGRNVLYTGDFKTADDVPEKVRSLIGSGGRLNALVCEGTNIRTIGSKPPFKDETVVEEKLTELMEQHSGTVFVLCSSTNEPRVRTVFAASAKSGRTVCCDLFMTAVREGRETTVDCDLQPFIAYYIDKSKKPFVFQHFTRLAGSYSLCSQQDFFKLPQRKTVFIRSAMLPFVRKYLNAKPDDHVLVYSLWDGYRHTGSVKKICELFKERGIPEIPAHCSGHAYGDDIRTLINRLEPEMLIPVHCPASDRALFESLHSHCVMLGDKETCTL